MKNNLKYSQTHQFEPLLPQVGVDALYAQVGQIYEISARLGAGAHPDTIESLKELVRSMNSYYSNRIEGQYTHPANIERALAHDFSDQPDTAKRQRIAIAYIDAEKQLEHSDPSIFKNALSSKTLLYAHNALYTRLSAEDRLTADGRVIEPGRIRQEEVVVGQHEPPVSSSIPDFLNYMDKIYDQETTPDKSLVKVACAHQRSMWVHPFLDGNGRAVRLQTHLALLPLTRGLWSMNRGLARNRDAYYALLSAADHPRQGDLDGRGNLSEKTLRQWCQWFIDLAQDQVCFMEKMLDLNTMKRNIEALVIFKSGQNKSIRKETILPLYHLYLAGPTKRGDFLQMTGLGERTARATLSSLIETGIVTSENHKAPIKLAFQLDSLQFLLPNLYPEASTENF
jgi:Fic family protein